MVKKLLFISSVFVLLFFAMAGRCFADASAQLEQAKLNIISLIQEGNYAEAQAQMQKMIVNFSSNDQVAEVIHQIAQQYQESKQFDKAIELSQYALDNWPQTASAIWLQMRIAVCNIARGNDYIAQEAISKLTSEYSQHPHLPLTLYILAEQYRLSLRFEEARSIYQQIIQNHPDSAEASKAEFGFSMSDVISLIISQDYDRAEEAFDKLVAEFAGHKDFPYAVWQIAKGYEGSNKYEKALQLHQYNVNHSSKDDMYAMWSQVEIVYSHIRDANDAAADAAFGKLLALFSEQPTLLKEVYQIADAFSSAGRYDMASQLYQYVVDNHSQTRQTIWTKTSTAKLNIIFGNEAAAQAALNNLISDFKDHPDLAQMVLTIGEEYYNKAFLAENEGRATEAKEHLRKAIAVWERIITASPQSNMTAYAYYFAADCYRRLGQHQKAIEYYQNVVDNWPEYKYAWNALFLIGRMYENLGEAEVISKSEADLKTRAAYEQLLEKHPDCPAVKIARRWLTRHK